MAKDDPIKMRTTGQVSCESDVASLNLNVVCSRGLGLFLALLMEEDWCRSNQRIRITF